jgi:hypothetical protein
MSTSQLTLAQFRALPLLRAILATDAQGNVQRLEVRRDLSTGLTLVGKPPSP